MNNVCRIIFTPNKEEIMHLKWVKGQILCYVYFITIFLKLEKKEEELAKYSRVYFYKCVANLNFLADLCFQ